MAKGDDDDIELRFKSVHPLGWFPDDDPVRSIIERGYAWAAARVWELLQFVKLQTRLATTTGGFLDLYALDFFGLRIKRRAGQLDEHFRAVVSKEIIRERATRKGLTAAVADYSGKIVVPFEPFHGGDCGGYDMANLGYDDTGRWGSIDHPRQIFLEVVQPVGEGIKHSGGFDTPPGGMEVAPLMHGDQRLVTGPITHADIYRIAEANKPAGITVWVDIGPAPIIGDRLDENFVLDESHLPGGYGL